MSDLMPRSLCHCGCTPYLCPKCNPRRSLVAAVRDISAVRDMPIWVWDDLLLPKADVVSLAAEREKRRPVLIRGVSSL